MKKALLFLPVLFLICASARATNYYLAANGNDGNNGTSTSSPWKTLSKLNSFFGSLKSGDNVYLNRGDVFYGSLTITKSGSSGSPITISAYGSGANPIITGFTTVTSWTNLGSNIWESSSAVSSLSTCNIVVINGVNTPMGRYPNTGWLTYQSHSGTTSITSNQLSGSTNWTGAESVTRIIRWTLQRDKIKSQSGGTITFTGSGDAPTNGYGFFIQNDPRTLDAQNEWYYNPSTKKIRVYSPGNPSNVQVATVDELVLTSKANYITFDHIDFKGANSYLLENSSSQYVIVQNCGFSLSGNDGLYISSSSGNEIMTVSNNILSDNNSSAIFFSSYTSKALITNNTINNSGMIPGAGTNDSKGYDAIVINGANSVVEYNSIINAGHNAITINQSEGLVARYNYISYFGMTRYDAGAVYSWNQNPTTVKSRIIDHNVVIYCKQSNDGIGTNSSSLFGIYLDGSSQNTSITNNTVAHCQNGTGILILNSGLCSILNNVCYDNGNQLLFTRAWGGGMPITGMLIKKNIFFSKTNLQPTFIFRDDDNILFNSFGTADSNYYAMPLNNSSPIATQVNYDVTKRTLSGWQTLSGQDAHSKIAPKSITDTNDLRFEYNATSSNKTISLPYNYIDAKGTSYNGSITLAPYSSTVLIKNGAASGANNNGLNYTYYEGTYSKVPDFSTLIPVKQGTTNNFDITLANRADQFAFNFTGFINIPTSGKYNFYTTSDDGSKLYIDGVWLVNNDGYHSAREASGGMNLTAGMHSISVGFFESTNSQVLTVSYSGPGISKQVIPPSILFTNSNAGNNVGFSNSNNVISQTIRPAAITGITGITAYPNPFMDYIKVDIAGDAGDYKLALVDVSGKILWTKTGSKNAGTFTQTVSTSFLQRGMYFLRIIQGDKSSVIKLVK